MKDVGKMQFRFQEKSKPMGFCTSLSSRMQLYSEEDMPHFLRQRYEMDEFDAKLI